MRSKSGTKASDESLRLNKRNNSLRGDTSIAKPLVTNLSGLSIGLQDKQTVQPGNSGPVEIQDKFKNYKGGKLSQEFYYKTLSLANNTMDRRELNSSINQKGPRLVQQDYSMNNKNLNLSSTAVNGKLEAAGSRINGVLNSASVGAVPLDNPKNSPLIVHKRSNTFNELLVNKLESKRNEQASLAQVPPKGNLSMTQPVQAKKPMGIVNQGQANTSNSDDQQHNESRFQNRPPSATQVIKEKRSSSFYNEKKMPHVPEDSSLPKSNSVEPKKPKRSESGKRRTPGKAYNFIENIKRFENQLPPFENSRTVVKDFDKIKAFSVNTHQGTVRAYNEDRVSILLNAQQR